MADNIEEIKLETIKTKAVRGVVVLTGRTFLLSVLSLVATGFLTVFLEPSEFGIFWIISAIVNFLAYFSDIGLAAALIQKKEKPDDEDLKTTFTVQQILVLLIMAAIFLGTPVLARVYHLSKDGVYLLYSLAISLFLSSLKTIPSVLLERGLEFEKLVLPQILENFVYNILAVFLAWKGFGIKSFTIAVFARGLVGLIAMYILKPWKPGLAFSRKSLNNLLHFGLPYQANTLLATVKDDAMTAFLGGILGPTGIGLLGWAQKWGYAPLRFFMDHVVKVTFPAFARMQDNKEELKRTVEHSIFFICFLVFPMLFGLLSLAPMLVKIIPRYEKWAPALTALFLIGVNTVFASVTTQLTNFLNAVGKIKTTFKLMIMWTVLTWALVPFLAWKFGVNGAALAYAIIGVSSVIAIFIVRKLVKFSLLASAIKPFVSAALMGALIYFAKRFLPLKFYSLIFLILGGAIFYFILSYFLVGKSLIDDFKKGVKTFFSRR